MTEGTILQSSQSPGKARPPIAPGGLRRIRRDREVKPSQRYLVHGELHATLQRRVEAHFARAAAEPASGMWRKTLIILAWFAASYGLLMFWASAPWQAGLCA